MKKIIYSVLSLISCLGAVAVLAFASMDTKHRVSSLIMLFVLGFMNYLFGSLASSIKPDIQRVSRREFQRIMETKGNYGRYYTKGSTYYIALMKMYPFIECMYGFENKKDAVEWLKTNKTNKPSTAL